jgi:adenine-specific DNA-methyltransferase
MGRYALKYMGSKAVLLRRGLGELIISESKSTKRFVDLFTGAAHVAHFAATNTPLPVLALDLQAYGAVLAGAVVERNRQENPCLLESSWLRAAARNARRSALWKKAEKLPQKASTFDLVLEAREFSAHHQSEGPILKAYGGHYFSPTQAIILDHMLAALPARGHLRKICLATTICVASRCAAAPGHTAQPFQPSEKGGVYIIEAWRRDPINYALQYLQALCRLHAAKAGKAFIGDAVRFSRSLNSEDLVFVDPPYSDVQYSRFYHVLETVAVGYCGGLSGNGRYPPREERPQSDFSKRTKSFKAIEDLLLNLSGIGATVILTFPAGLSSNGISGTELKKSASQLFSVKGWVVNGHFSTLGGNRSHREPRQKSEELIMLLKSKGRIKPHTRA